MLFRPSEAGPAEIDADAAAQAVAGGAVLLDVREPMEFQQARAPQARLIPMGEVPSRLGELERDRQIVVVCRSGNRSAAVTAYLVREGHDAVNLAGGMIAWQRAGLPIVSGDGSR